MATASPQDAILDTSVLVNFLLVGRLDLLTEHPRYRFIVTNHVRREITDDYPDQVALVDAAVSSGGLREIEVQDPVEVNAFGKLHASGRLGAGECSAIAVAVNRGLPLAIDDKAAKKEARRFSKSVLLLETETIMVSLIRHKVLDVGTADAIKQDWEQSHRFKLPFQTFQERL